MSVTASHYLQRSRQINMIPTGTVRPASDPADEIARLPEFTNVFNREQGRTQRLEQQN